MKDTYKIIIWGLGSVGRSALQIINRRSSLELVAAYDVDPKKIGRDAGEVCGFEACNVKVSADREEVLNTPADIVLYYASSVWDKGSLPDFARSILFYNGFSEDLQELCFSFFFPHHSDGFLDPCPAHLAAQRSMCPLLNPFHLVNRTELGYNDTIFSFYSRIIPGTGTCGRRWSVYTAGTE